MINEIKVDYKNPLWVNVWNNGCGKARRIYLFSFDGRHYCVAVDKEVKYLSGEKFAAVSFENIEFVKPKKLIQLDAKSCPRRPVLTHPNWGEGVEIYPSIRAEGLESTDRYFLWKDLFEEKGFKINDQPASREVDE